MIPNFGICNKLVATASLGISGKASAILVRVLLGFAQRFSPITGEVVSGVDLVVVVLGLLTVGAKLIGRCSSFCIFSEKDKKRYFNIEYIASKENSKKRTVKQTEKIIKNLFIFVSNIVNFMILKNWKFYLSKQSSISRQNQPNANNKNGKIF